jgi:hypothetical protein
MSRRAETLQLPRSAVGSGAWPVHLLVDSTGLKLCGPGEWLVEKHGTRTRRGWRKLHLATDADTGRIVVAVLTEHDADDGSQVGRVLDQVDGPVASFTGDGAYDRDDVYAEVAVRHAEAAASCRHVRARCQATRPRPRQHSATVICSVSLSAATWGGSGRRDTTGVLWSSPISRDGNASSAMHYTRKQTGVRPDLEQRLIP